jgi:LytR cell envelope-related transcriptional attenuator
METERPTARSNPARGVALIATAVVLGLFIVRNGFDTPSSADDGSPTTEASSGTTAPAGGEGGTTTTAAGPAAHPPAEVTVLVANASGVSGAAGEMTATLASQQYQTVPETNAPNSVGATQVLFTSGFDADAPAVAAAIGAPAESVAPMPNPPPVELSGAQILVLLGPDLANG